MKKIVALLMVMASVFAVSARDKISRDISILPVPARTVLNGNFKAKVSFIKIDKNLGFIEDYEVVLEDGSEITFDRNGNWKDVEVRNSSSVPGGFLLSGISTYVRLNHKNQRIVGIEKEGSGFDVELSNGMNLKFDKNGKFVKYDD